MSAELSQLIELQELDIEIQRVTDRVAKIPVERDQIENEFNQYAAEFLALKSRYEQTLEDRKQLELDLAHTQQQHEKFEQDKMRVRNTKEYETAIREIDATKKQISAFETEILKSMEEIEKLEADLKVAAPDIERKRAEADLTLEALDKERQQADEQLLTLGKRRAHLSSLMPRQLFSSYDRMARLRRGQVLAELRGGICMACRMKVRPKVISDVRKGDQLITCESCGRILYARPASAQSAEAGIGHQSTTE